MSRIAKAWIGVGLLMVAGGSQTPPRNQAAEYEADASKTILELQQFRQSSSVPIRSTGGKQGIATLVNLNPAINSWYLLNVVWNGSASQVAYHLENSDPRTRRILLDERYPQGIVLADGNKRDFCELFGGDLLEQAKASPLVFYPLCDGRIYLRNPASGHRSTLEAATEFLREHVWGGEKIVNLGHILMGDMNRETGELETKVEPAPTASGDSPLPALIDARFADRILESYNLGIDLEGSGRPRMTPGSWRAANGNPGIYISLMQPDLADPSIFKSYRTSVSALDSIEASALVYLVAFDLDRFDVGFALGTDHPKVGWSDQISGSMRNPALPGPDGIGTISPLVATGLISPGETAKTVATFTGGFKRQHGAFKYGVLAQKNHGSHYGFIENGVVFSKLQPGLATIFVLENGAVEMKTWTGADNNLLPRIEHARQNGVPLIEFDQTRQGAPGPLVNQWGAGNWSGSEEGKLRTMRAGMAMQRNPRKAVLDLRRVFRRDALRHGSHFSGVPVRLRHASRHERPGTHLSGGLPAHRAAVVCGPPSERE